MNSLDYLKQQRRKRHEKLTWLCEEGCDCGRQDEKVSAAPDKPKRKSLQQMMREERNKNK